MEWTVVVVVVVVVAVVVVVGVPVLLTLQYYEVKSVVTRYLCG